MYLCYDDYMYLMSKAHRSCDSCTLLCALISLVTAVVLLFSILLAFLTIFAEHVC